MTSLEIERKLNSQGFGLVGGVDEVGRGCLAGPVFAAAVILNNNIDLKNIKDSKKISFKKRILIAKYIKKKFCLFFWFRDCRRNK